MKWTIIYSRLGKTAHTSFFSSNDSTKAIKAAIDYVELNFPESAVLALVKGEHPVYCLS
jgi:hypothetical protein